MGQCQKDHPEVSITLILNTARTIPCDRGDQFLGFENASHFGKCRCYLHSYTHTGDGLPLILYVLEPKKVDGGNRPHTKNLGLLEIVNIGGGGGGTTTRLTQPGKSLHRGNFTSTYYRNDWITKTQVFIHWNGIQKNSTSFGKKKSIFIDLISLDDFYDFTLE